MNIWEILEIQKTKDIKVIKNAYANVAKKYHPEEQPEQFQKLQAAYKAAVAYAKDSKEQKEDLAFSQIAENKNNEKNKIIKTESQYEKLEKQVAEELKDKLEAEEQKKRNEREAKSRQEFNFENLNEIYEEGEEEEASADVFWDGFYAMLWHPYLRKSKLAWEIFFEQKKYGKLLSNDAFRRDFVERVVAENIMWTHDILQFFVGQLFGIREEERQKWMQLEYEVAFFNKICGGCSITKLEHREFEKIFHADAKRQLYNKENDAVDKYLKMYFEYASQHQKKLSEIYAKSTQYHKRKQNLIKTLLIILIVTIVMIYTAIKM